MPELTTDCPRCGARQMTFDVAGWSPVPANLRSVYQQYELQCTCRLCKQSTLFLVRCRGLPEQKHVMANTISGIKGSLNDFVSVDCYISIRDYETALPPEDLPKAIHDVFAEGATCMAVGCNNAAATMFRLCIDLATKSLLPEGDADGLNQRVRRNLGFRLPWLFDHDRLPRTLAELSSCIKEDGNDGAHEGTLQREDAEDILDFTRVLLERLYSEPAQLVRANERRVARRATESTA